MAGIAAPQPGNTVENLPPIVTGVIHSLGCRQQPRIALELAVRRERHPQRLESGSGLGGGRTHRENLGLAALALTR